MPCEINREDDIVEITVTGTPTKWELLETFRKLQRADPLKEMPELWTLAEYAVFPVEWHLPVADAAGKLCGEGMVGARTAIVACDALQKAQIEMYGEQARHLPFEIRVFTSRDEAVAWVKAGPNEAVSPTTVDRNDN